MKTSMELLCVALIWNPQLLLGKAVTEKVRNFVHFSSWEKCENGRVSLALPRSLNSIYYFTLFQALFLNLSTRRSFAVRLCRTEMLLVTD